MKLNFDLSRKLFPFLKTCTERVEFEHYNISKKQLSSKLIEQFYVPLQLGHVII